MDAKGLERRFIKLTATRQSPQEMGGGATNKGDQPTLPPPLSTLKKSASCDDDDPPFPARAAFKNFFFLHFFLFGRLIYDHSVQNVDFAH